MSSNLAKRVMSLKGQFTGTTLRTPTPELKTEDLSIEKLGQLVLDLNKTTLFNYGAGMAAPQLGMDKRLFVMRHEFFSLQSPLTALPYAQGTTSSYNARTSASKCAELFRSPEALRNTPTHSGNEVPMDTFQNYFRAFSLKPRQQEELVLDYIREFLVKKTPCVPVINPVIILQNEEKLVGNEGCFSVPDWQAAVVRPLSIDVEFLTFDEDPKADPLEPPNPFDPSATHVVKKTLTLREFAARAFLHEVDHLNGVVFTDRADPDSFYFVANGGEVIYANELNENELKRAPPFDLLFPVPKNYNAYGL